MVKRITDASRIADSIDRLCEKMDEIAGIVRYMANRDSVDWKGHEQKCSDTKSE